MHRSWRAGNLALPFFDMRIALTALILGLVLVSPGRADQHDGSLDALFAALQAGEGDADEIAREIETRWLAPPEPGIAVLVERIVQAIDADDLDVAHLLSDHLTGIAPSYAEGWVIRGQILSEEDDPAGAVLALRRAVTLEPRHYVALELLGDLALTAGDKERAHQRYREALDINPQDRALRREADRLRRDLGSQEI